MPFQIETRTQTEGPTIVAVCGELDVYTSPRLRQEIAELLTRGDTHLVVDLDRVDYLDSTALGVLVGAARRVVQQHGTLKLACANGRNRRIFEITGLTKVFDFVDSCAGGSPS